jgi:flavin-dependent dehydrogenase
VRFFRLGDAAGYVEPFTGEGMAWALAAAEAVVPLARQAADDWRPGLARAWERRLARRLAGPQRRCRWVAWLLRSPLLTGWAVGLLARWPGLARPWVPSASVRP